MTSLVEAQAIQTGILRAMAEHGQRPIAEAAGLSETRLSRWKSADSQGGGLDLDETCSVLAALGLAVVLVDPEGTVTVSASTHSALHILLRDYADLVVNRKVRAACE